METRIDVEKSIRFFFEDPDWVKKLLIGAVLLVSVIGLPAFLGWSAEIQRRSIEQSDDLVPDWNDLGGLWVTGFRIWLAQLVYGLPMLLIIIVITGGAVVVALFTQSMSDEAVAALAITVFGGFMVFAPFIYLYFGLLWVLTPFITGCYLENDSLKDALNVRRVFQLFRANWIEAIVTMLVVYGLAYMLGMVGMVLFLIGTILVTPYNNAIMYYLLGNVYRNAVQRLEHQQQLQAG